MNLKQRFSVTFSLLFSVLLGGVLTLIFVLFANYRKEDFKARLANKAETTIKLLLDVKEIDNKLLGIIDKSSTSKLNTATVLIFDDDFQLLYSSPGEAQLNWDKNDLFYLREHNELYRNDKGIDVYGMYYSYEGKNYPVLVTAEDKHGNKKLDYLRYLLLGAFVFGTISVWALSFHLSKRSFNPLDKFSKNIQSITDQNLNSRLPVSNSNDEIDALSNSFNQMMDRIDMAYNKQKEFTGNASHELRTPISRITAQLENVLQSHNLDEKTRIALRAVSEESYQLSDVVTSLLILSRLNTQSEYLNLPKVRVDEIIFGCTLHLNKLYPDLKLVFEIVNVTNSGPVLEIKGDEMLLKIAVSNLLKNAYLYSDNKEVNCLVRETNDEIQLIISNTGETPDVEDPATLFNTFSRGNNVQNKPGSGLGLSIVKRIIEYHQANISYRMPGKNYNEIIVTFKK